MANTTRFFWIPIVLGLLVVGAGMFSFAAGVHLLEFGAEGCDRPPGQTKEPGCIERSPGYRWINAGMTMMPVGAGLFVAGAGIGGFHLVRRRLTRKQKPN